jgi:hypothetical protein
MTKRIKSRWVWGVVLFLFAIRALSAIRDWGIISQGELFLLVLTSYVLVVWFCLYPIMRAIYKFSKELKVIENRLDVAIKEEYKKAGVCKNERCDKQRKKDYEECENSNNDDTINSSGYLVRFDEPDQNGVIVKREAIDVNDLDRLALRGSIIDHKVDEHGVRIINEFEVNGASILTNQNKHAE